MTCTESFGGICPNCEYTKMFLRYGSGGIFEFDACPKCGFAFATNGDSPLEGDEFWENTSGNILLAMFRDQLKEHGFSPSRRGLYMLTLIWDEDDADVNNVFKYSKEDVKRIMLKVKKSKECVQFT
jgi:Zn-finger nucleic acid-binding protein